MQVNPIPKPFRVPVYLCLSIICIYYFGFALAYFVIIDTELYILAKITQIAIAIYIFFLGCYILHDCIVKILRCGGNNKMKDKKYTIGMILIAVKEEMFQNQVVEVKTKTGSIFAPVLTFETSPGAMIAACENFVVEVNKIVKDIQKEKKEK